MEGHKIYPLIFSFWYFFPQLGPGETCIEVTFRKSSSPLYSVETNRRNFPVHITSVIILSNNNRHTYKIYRCLLDLDFGLIKLF